ncbi:MAG: hypothetical protein GDA51_09790 [Ekhidna sp.]|nr:hypothetical protein [Ekhidna sp.]MBC6409408.1 hypothetical protein [Ekhidna sp.]MBC6426737.1 hypothetical protein [Ekhidna sp.]
MRTEPGRYILSVLAALISFSASSQEIFVRGGFVEDSLVIGQNINYWVAAEYPPIMEMVFPDSNADFSPFEWADKQYFPSQLVGKQAYDSTVYTLRSFEIDPVQYLQLDAFILNHTDSIRFTIPMDSIYLAELAPVVTDTTALKTNLTYQAVGQQFNYPLFYYILAGLVLLILLLLLIFGKRISRYFRLRRLARDYRTFSEALDTYVSSLKKEPSAELAEKALSLWKIYQQKLDKVAFTTFTTKEILSLKFANELENPLKSIDRAVYGNRADKNLYQEFQLIENFTQERYQKRVEKIRHGK